MSLFWVTSALAAPREAASPSNDGRFIWSAATAVARDAVPRDAQSGKTLRTWEHKDGVTAVAFSPDGRRVLTGSWDNTAVLRDAQSGQILHTWNHEQDVNAVAFSPDGRQVLTGSWDNTVVLLDVQSGETLLTWKHQGPVNTVAFSPDGQRVLTGSADNTAVLRDAQSGQTLRTWNHQAAVTAVAFSPDGRRVLTGSWDKTAVLRDAQSGQTLYIWKHQGNVATVAFSPDGLQVLTGSHDKTAVLRDAQSGETLRTWSHKNAVTVVAFSPDGRQVLTGSWDNTAVLRILNASLNPSLSDALNAALLKIEQARRRPATLTRRQAELEQQRPTKDEFESQAQYQARVSQWNATVERLNKDIRAHEAAVGPLPLAARAQAMQQAVGDIYGKPRLTDIRYDPETARFYATLKADLDPALRRTLAIEVSNAEARAVKAALDRDASAIQVQMRVDDQNTLFWEGASITLDAKTRVVQFTDTDFVPQAIASTALPNLAAIATSAPLATLPIAEVRLSDDPNLAKLQREVLEREQAQAQKAQREAETQRLEARLAQLKTAPNAAFDDDLTPQLAALPTAKADRNLYALIIGIDDYADVPDVPFANHSAKLFAEIARKKWGVPPENLILLTDADATLGRLRGRIKTLLNRLGPKDRLLVYYAGHGVPSQDGKSAYLLAQDGGPGSYEEPDLQLEVFYRQIEESRVGQASVFIDACFSGRSGKDSIVFEGVGGITLVPRTAVKPNGKLSVITAGRKDQFSNQDKAHGHRLFGYHLMKSMLEGPGNLNMTTLHEQIRDRVLADSRKIGPEFEQEPEMLGNAKIKID